MLTCSNVYSSWPGKPMKSPYLANIMSPRGKLPGMVMSIISIVIRAV